MTTTVELHRLDLSLPKLKALAPDELYVFALSGHVFNELMLLQKMVLTSVHQQTGNVHPFVQDASVARAVFALRLLVGKLEEAMRALGKQSVEDVMRQKVFALRPGLEARWDNAVQTYKTMPWLTKIRNQRAFHYMNKSQWLPHLTDEVLGGAYVIVGSTYGNTLFQWHEVAAGVPMLKLVDENDPLEGGLGTILDQTGELLSDLTSCLAEGLQAYMHAKLTEPGALADATEVAAPALSSVVVPYFHSKDPA